MGTTQAIVPSIKNPVIKMEMVDIVDDQNRVLYAVTKEHAHSKGLLHRTVILEIRDEDNNIILVKQAPDRQDADQYVSPVGGHVRSSESELDALKREMMEEIGISATKYTFKGRFIFNRYILNRQENHYFIVYEAQINQKIKLGTEAVSYKKFTEKELKAQFLITEKNLVRHISELLKSYIHRYLIIENKVTGES